MTDKERLLEGEVAWLRHGPERLNLALRERNAVMNERPINVNDFKNTIVCGCKMCMASHRFGGAEPDNIFSSFDDDEEHECIVKKCLKYHCEKAGLVCIECDEEESLEKCHIALVDSGEAWKVVYGGLLSPELFHENPAYKLLCSLFDTVGDHEAGSGDVFGIGMTNDELGFFTDGTGTDYVAAARDRLLVGDRTVAEYRAAAMERE
jgi:hypothetical protein